MPKRSARARSRSAPSSSRSRRDVAALAPSPRRPAEIDLELARQVWADSVVEDRRAYRARLERQKVLAEDLEQLLSDARSRQREAADHYRYAGLIDPAATVLDGLTRAVEALELAAGAARLEAASARRELDRLPRATSSSGRPSRAAEFLRRMIERAPHLPRDADAWLRLHDRLPFTGPAWQSDEARARTRRRIEQLLRRLQTVAADK